MNKIAYFIVVVMSFSLVLSQGKPCCKNKAGKEKVACKSNQANLDINKDGVISDEESLATKTSETKCAKSANVSSTDEKACAGCKSKPWWKFWAKKKSCCKSTA